MDLLTLDDDSFRKQWTALSRRQRDALPPEIRTAGFNRYNSMLAHREVDTEAESAAWNAAVAIPDPIPVEAYIPHGGNGSQPPEPPHDDAYLQSLADRADTVWEQRLNAPVSKADQAEPQQPRRHMDWPVLAQGDAPEFEWLIPHWLSWHPTLLSGRGSIGKSLLAQQLATALATGTPFIGAPCKPMKVLCWMCEDEHDELWRRQERICAAMKVQMGNLANLTIDARYGLKNELFVTEYGRGAWTPIIGELQHQIEQTQADVVILDNIAHVYGGDENSRHLVTLFTNGLVGLANGSGRKIATLLLGHPAKSLGSEYSGSTAWENAVRMRWYMNDKLPDQKEDDPDAEPDTNTRYLSKRKSNYTALDYIKFRFDGEHKILVPEQDASQQQDSGTMQYLRRQRAETVVLNAVRKLSDKSVFGTDSPSRTFLPTVILQYKLQEECTKRELAEAMRALIMDGKLSRQPVGRNAAGKPRDGLVEVKL